MTFPFQILYLQQKTPAGDFSNRGRQSTSLACYHLNLPQHYWHGLTESAAKNHKLPTL